MFLTQFGALWRRCTHIWWAKLLRLAYYTAWKLWQLEKAMETQRCSSGLSSEFLRRCLDEEGAKVTWAEVPHVRLCPSSSQACQILWKSPGRLSQDSHEKFILNAMACQLQSQAAKTHLLLWPILSQWCGLLFQGSDKGSGPLRLARRSRHTWLVMNQAGDLFTVPPCWPVYENLPWTIPPPSIWLFLCKVGSFLTLVCDNGTVTLIDRMFLWSITKEHHVLNTWPSFSSLVRKDGIRKGFSAWEGSISVPSGSFCISTVPSIP